MHRLCGAIGRGEAQVTRGPGNSRSSAQQAKARTNQSQLKEVVPITPLPALAAFGRRRHPRHARHYGVTLPASFLLLQRIFLFNVPLPTKTLVIAITHDLAIPLGTDTTISARAEGVIHHRKVVYHLWQGGSQEFPVRRISPASDPGVFSFKVNNVQRALPISFSSTRNGSSYGHSQNSTRGRQPGMPEIYPDYTKLSSASAPATDLSLLAEAS